MSIEHALMAGAIRGFLKENPVSTFTADNIFESIDVANKNKNIFRVVLNDLAQAGSIISIQKGQGFEYAFGRNHVEVLPQPDPPKEEPEEEEEEEQPQNLLPPVPKTGTQAAEDLDAEILRWLNLHPHDHYRAGEVSQAVCSRIGYKAPGDIGHRLRYLASIGKIYKAGYANNTRYQATPFIVEQKWMKPATAAPRAYDPPAPPALGNHLLIARDDLIKKRDQLQQAIDTIQKLIDMDIIK